MELSSQISFQFCKGTVYPLSILAVKPETVYWKQAGFKYIIQVIRDISNKCKHRCKKPQGSDRQQRVNSA